MLRIEHYGMCFTFWALIVVMVVQAWMGAEMKQLAGEWLVFMVLCIGMMIACVRKGLWDRRLRPTLKTNLLVSIVAAAAIAIFMIVRMWQNVGGDPTEFLTVIAVTSLIPAAITFVLCFALLTLVGHLTKKREQQIEQSLLDEDDTQDE